MIKSGFWWLIRAPDSEISGYRVFEGQNWMKIVVFCIFEFWPYMVLISVNTTTKIVKKWFRSLKKPDELFQKLACDPDLTRHRCFYWSLFHLICLKTIFSIFPLFQSPEKSVFSPFLKLGSFYGFGHENHSEQVHGVWLSEFIQLEQLFLTFWKKLIFPISDSTFSFKK